MIHVLRLTASADLLTFSPQSEFRLRLCRLGYWPHHRNRNHHRVEPQGALGSRRTIAEISHLKVVTRCVCIARR